MIYLHGYLANKYGEKHVPQVHSAAEAIRAMEANHPGFRHDIKKDMYYSIVRGEDLNKGKDIGEEELTMSFGTTDWHIIPAVEGSKSGGVFRILLGAMIIGASFFMPAAGITFMGMTITQGSLVLMGAGMILGGISMMLAPSVQTQSYESRERPEERASYLFEGPTNRTEQGHAIPIVYGEAYVGSIVVSAGVDVGDIA